MKKTVFTALLAVFWVVSNSFGQAEGIDEQTKKENFFNTDMDYQLRAFFSIGGSTPLGFPTEIKKVLSYNPQLQLGLEANATKWLGPTKDWGIRAGVAVEGRGMKTKARVERYLIRIIQGNEEIMGYYTGTVQTQASNTYVTIPVSAVYNLSQKWNLYGGLFTSFRIDQQFSGYVSDGFLRQGTPSGPKITFEDGARGAYDFSKEVQLFQWGAHIGAEWQMGKHFKLFPTFNYTFNGLINPDFEAISFNLHSIYLDLGFGYKF